jgi:phospholipid/cholesterol/gamma-HCH transport system substrate-binding protein
MAEKSKVLTWTELRVGVVVLVSLVVLAFTILYTGGGGGSPFAPKYNVKALMADVNGLKPGAPVRLGGVEVGTVTQVGFAPAGGGSLVEVTMRIDRRVAGRITTESEANLGSLGLLGEKAVDIAASARGRALQDGDFLSAAAEDPFKGLLTETSESTSHLKRILARMDAGEGTLGKALRDEELYNRMVDVGMRLQAVMGKLESPTGPLGRLVNDNEMSRQLGASARSLESILARIDSGDGAFGVLTKDQEFGKEIKGLTTNLHEISGRLSRGEGTAGRLLKDDALYERLDEVSARLDGVLTRLDKGEGSAGKLLHDAELYDNLSAALKEMRQLVADVRRDPGRYLRVKVSLF